jgi:SAM-dependent methyltransferase
VCEDDVIDLYERHALSYARDRGRSLAERVWLDRFRSFIPAQGTVLDLGCGVGEPIVRYLSEHGLAVVGVDASPSMIELCHARFPESEWVVADMRELELGRRFDGIIAWDSFFHLAKNEQRRMFRRLASHARLDAPLMFTSGPAEGVTIGSYCGDPLYHASLSPVEYDQLLSANGFTVRAHVAEDSECGGHTVWLSTYHGDAPIARL